MFDLGYSLAETVEINGETYNINLTFDNVLRLMDMLNDESLDDETKLNTGIVMLIGTSLNCDLQTKSDIFVKIFEETVGKEKIEDTPVDIEGNPMPVQHEREPYDLKQDAKYIYASFMQCYGMDLIEQQGKLHWEKFKALLAGLDESTIFKKIIDIRTRELPSGKGTVKEREMLKKLKEQYKLKDS